MNREIADQQAPPHDSRPDRLLIVGMGADPATAEQVSLAIPGTELVCEDEPLAGLVRAGREEFQTVMLRICSTDIDHVAKARAFRKLTGQRHLILLTDVWDEPVARKLKAEGLADDYAVLPIVSSELASAVPRMGKLTVGRSDKTAAARSASGHEGAPVGNGASNHQKLSRETAELIFAANLGLEQLLERICWSGMYLFDARGVDVEAQGRHARAGELGGKYNLEVDLVEQGRKVGVVRMQMPPSASADDAMVGAWVHILPGLIRLASAQGQLREQANTDPLTGLANRRHMMELLTDLLERARKERLRVTVVLFDFDNFKHYNDTYGHAAGDEILRESAILIRKCIRRQDIAARYGGEEFVLILWDAQSPRQPGSDHPRSAMAIMDRFRKLLRQHYFPSFGPQAQGRLTVSGGLANFPWDANSAEELIEKADQALLEAKRSGKNRIYLVGQGPGPAAKELTTSVNPRETQ